MKSEKTITKQKKRSSWFNHIKQWKTSGQSQSHYCRDNQLKLHQFIYWKQVFNPKQKVKPNMPTESGFVAVQLASAQRSPSSSMVIQLPNGIRIEHAQSNDLALIHEITRWQR